MTMLSGVIANLLIASLLVIYAYYFPASSFALTASLCAFFLYFLTLRSLDPLLDLDGYLALENALDAPKLREAALGRLSRNRKQKNIYFIYYFIYVLLNFILIYILQNQLRPFGIAMWNGGLIYLLLVVGLGVELFIEMNSQRKIRQILAAESNSEEI